MKKRFIYIIAISALTVSFILIGLLIVLASQSTTGRLNSLVLRSHTSEKLYDGTPLTCQNYTLESGALKSGHTIQSHSWASITDVGTAPNYFAVEIIDSKGNNVSENYNISFQFGELGVMPLPLAISSSDAIKEYDAIKLISNEYEIVSGELLINHALNVTVIGERTEAGISDNSFTVQIVNERQEDITFNYVIEKIFGKLEVKKRKITISTPSFHKIYDGKPLRSDEWNYTSQTTLVDGHKINVIISGVQTDAGVSKNSIAEVIVTDATGDDVTRNYEFLYQEGDLLVSKLEISLRSESAKKVYDGTPLINHNWNIASTTQPLENHDIFVDVTGQRTQVGTSPNYIAEVRILLGTKSVMHNYSVTLQIGDLTVIEQSQTSNQPSEMENGGGMIANPNTSNDKEDEPTAKIYSQISGEVYLRCVSFGDYNGKGFDESNPYPYLIDGKYSLNYLTSTALKNIANESYKFSIESLSNNYILPYYLDLEPLSYEIQTSDTAYRGSTEKVYSGYYYSFDYSGQNLSLPTEYSQMEQNYYNYVVSEYLAIPSNTYLSIKEILDRNGLNGSDPDIISKVQHFLNTNAIYNIKYDRNLDLKEDIVVSFLNDYGEGICGHFASSATMIFRALGIPARYTVGYYANTMADEWTSIYGKNAHAWVEVYIRGIGWIFVEATPPVFSDIDENENIETKTNLNIKPIDQYLMYYSGAVLRAENQVQGLSNLLQKGYTYDAIITGEQNSIGIGYSQITSFTLYDEKGNDVTSTFDITFLKGKLHIYIREISVTSPSLAKTYDGVPLQANADDFIIDGDLFDGHIIEYKKPTGTQADIGSSENSLEIKIAHLDGFDVTHMYKINNNYGTLTVNPREIIIEAGSMIKEYDGIPLTCSTYNITSIYDEPLANGDRAEVTTKGSQTNIGRSENEIFSVKIFNKNGKEVTKNYSIAYISGLLTVTR